MIALLLALADPCAPPPAAAARDPASARVYVEVGENAAGPTEVLEAFREALRLDPSNARAQAGFQAACRPGDDRFEKARARMDAGDRAGAIAIFEQLRPMPAAALLEGICLYELEQDDAAETALLEAQADDATADAARFFLGLLARRRGQQAEAEQLFTEVAQGNSSVADQARRLLKPTRLSVSALAESGYDSNVSLAPTNAPLGGDALGSLAAAVVWRPVEGLFVRASGFYRAQPTLSDYDLGALGGTVGYGWGPLSAEYDYDFVALGNAPYLSANRLGLAGRLPLGAWTLSAGYGARFENYRTSVTSVFSGTLHGWQIAAALRLSREASVEIAYRFARDWTDEAATTYFEHGPAAVLRFGSGRVRLSIEASAAFRLYEAFDDSVGVQQQDSILDAALLGEYDVDPRWTVRLALGGRDQISNVDELTYTRAYATLGVAFAAGL
ncbi:MAG TPA: hypothetical protein VLW85_07360 [Myxococcales bacterium]|nr:hypothetical protein [Myxococcales bacterium]